MSTFYAVIIVIAVISLILSVPSVKGKIGESKVSFLLNRLDKEKYFVLNDLLLPTEQGKTSQIDHVVVSPYGIFVVETKNYQGWIFGDEKNKYWTQQIYKNKQRFYNPIWQNYGHIKAIESVLSNDDLPIYSIVVFSTKARLKKINIKSNNVHVVYTVELLKTIKKYQKNILSLNEAKTIANDLKAYLSKDRASARKHVKQIRESQVEVKNKVNNNICPKCGGELVMKSGKYGNFMGCSNFPKCRFVVTNKRAR